MTTVEANAAEGTAAAALPGPHRPVARMLRLLRDHAGRLVLALGASVAAELAALALMAVAAWLIARAAQQPPLAALSLAIVGVRAFATSRGLFRYGERLASHDVALRGLATLRARVYDALVPLAPTGLPAYRSADLLQRMVADVEAIQDLVVRVVVPAGTALAVGAVAVGFTAWSLPAGAAVLAAGLVVAGVAVPLLTLALGRRSARLLAPERAEFAARSVDLLQGAPDLAVFGAAPAALADADDASARVERLERHSAMAASGASALSMLVQGGTATVVTLLALRAAEAGELAAVMVPVLALVALISFEPVLPLVAAARHYLEARASAGRVLAVLDTAPPVAEPQSAPTRPALSRHPEIELRGAQVRYQPDRPPALDGVDLRFDPDRRVAVVGASGSGKSTLLAVLMRFVDLDAGSMTIDGTDVRTYDGDDVRTLVTGVTQDAHLFHTTIRENLRLGRAEATDDDLRTALAEARALDWVDDLPRGLDTLVGEHGAQLSGGQRQRLALARALLADPPVLVLDEPTEGLDPDVADELTADLLAATTGRTTVLVTHRLAGLDQVDEIVVLDAGRVVQRGHHAELVDADGPYRDLRWTSSSA